MWTRVRVIVTVGLALVVWLVASPARAAAPQCDTRGATTFAPAPTMDPPKESIDVGDGDSPCAPSFSLEAVSGGRAPSEGIVVLALSAVLPHGVVLAPPRRASICPPPDVVGGERRGVRSAVERPPRG